MPEKSIFSRLKLVRTGDMPPPPVGKAPFVELGIATPFSFLRGASDAIELTLTALSQGYDAIGIADEPVALAVLRGGYKGLHAQKSAGSAHAAGR